MRIPTIFLAVLLLLVSATGKASEQQPINDTVQCFSANYTEARHKFLDASREASARVEHFQNPRTGPQGEMLYTDVALLGPINAGTILVLLSGTHGVEGFAGSAIQTCLLRKVFQELPPDIGLLFIHGINPYGFAHLRRFNEDNIDLNRNFIDHSKSYPASPDYDELADAINPKSLSIWANVRSNIKFFWYALTKGRDALKRTISAGQYSHPQGLFYGGRQKTWSNNTLRTIADRYLDSAKRVVIIDFHTGLGPFGHAEIIMGEPKQSSAYKRAASWWGERVRTTVNGGSVSTDLQGSLKLAWPEMLPNAEVTAVSQEFGTLSALQIFWALRNENWLHNHGENDHPKAEEIRARLLRAFYPDDNSWKDKVWDQGTVVVNRVLAALK
jgi:Protein of unknown function (DUF2817)